MTLRVRILGAAAGGGLPQWNCGCANCAAARRGDIPAQTQSSVAVSVDGDGWALLNASPDIRVQLAAAPCLHPVGARESPVRSVLVTNGDIDHIAGLLVLRESQPFTLFATAATHAAIADNPIFRALDPSVVRRETVAPGEPFPLLPGLTATLFSVPGKVPLYLEEEGEELEREGEETVGVTLRNGAALAHYVPGCARMTPDLAERLRGAPLVFFDGTLFDDDEMPRLGLGPKTGARMGHMAMSGPEGSLAALAPLGIGRKIFVHINNSNPALDPRSPERAEVEAAGWIVAEDGMEFAL